MINVLVCKIPAADGVASSWRMLLSLPSSAFAVVIHVAFPRRESPYPEFDLSVFAIFESCMSLFSVRVPMHDFFTDPYPRLEALVLTKARSRGIDAAMIAAAGSAATQIVTSFPWT
jgi:hypothetical protein